MNPEKSIRLIALPEVCSRVSMQRSTVLSWEAEGKFPRAVRLSSTKRVWLERDVDEWILSKHAAAVLVKETA